tara:strand:+ start:72 stop:695 length:624 start_codon:yes stop_codon:yes gene_type:complete
MYNLPTYNSEDLLVRTLIAASGIVKVAVNLAKHARAGSVNIAEQKALEMAVSQFELLRTYKILATSALGVFKPLTNTGSTVINTLLINSVVASGNFAIVADKTATSENIAMAINETDTVPNYTAVVVGDEVHITAATKGTASNGYDIVYSLVPGTVTSEFIHFFGAQDGAAEEDNLITEDTLEALFNNISNITGCGYAPLGTKYKTT